MQTTCGMMRERPSVPVSGAFAPPTPPHTRCVVKHGVRSVSGHVDPPAQLVAAKRKLPVELLNLLSVVEDGHLQGLQCDPKVCPGPDMIQM